ncbi:MAG: Addiction module toxin, RelE/StbE family [Parcubacteria group bacterium GW2011_GWB1_41_5]|nr:MAG: Addiction module toxin, RelE/StbE family [Parcubacteria group bacterium GW2011_GWB1_41_5]
MYYTFKGKSADEFSDLQKDIQLQIMKKLKFFMSSPDPLYFAEHLNNFDLGEYRFRVGDYRVSFDVENDTAKILKVAHRKDIYNKK